MYSATDTKTKRNYRRGREEKHHQPKELERSMHRIVATCFIPNDLPLNQSFSDIKLYISLGSY